MGFLKKIELKKQLEAFGIKIENDCVRRKDIEKFITTGSKPLWYTNLIKNGKILTYSSLPIEAQKALWHYMAVNGEKWTGSFSDSLTTYKDYKIGYTKIPTHELMKAVDIVYTNTEKNKKPWFDPDKYSEHWPVILDEIDVLQDGWRRFFTYRMKKMKYIPALYYP